MKTIIFLLLFIITFSCNQSEKFDSPKWKNWTETEGNPNTRLKMIPSLKRTHELKKLSKNQIIEILGEPERNFSKSWSYSLGPSGSGVNYAELYIEFSDSICTKHSIIEH